MPILKAPPKQIRNATIQVRVEEEVDLKLRKYAEYIDSTPAFVVAESLKLLFHKDTEFREWLAHHDDVPDPSEALAAPIPYAKQRVNEYQTRLREPETNPSLRAV
jgi:hypothetical protein